MEAFSDAVGLANGGDATTECTAQNNGGENANNGDNAVQNGARMNTNTQSYTSYCNRNGKFVTAQFGGAHCTEKSNLQLLDPLDTLNNELDNVGCLLVYSNGGNGNADADEAVERGAFGAPTCFVGGAMYWGNDRLHLVELDARAAAEVVS